MTTTEAQVKERPLLMCAEMVVATLEDRKTHTRRLNGLGDINKSPDIWSVVWQGVEETSGRWAVQFDAPKLTWCVRCPYGKPGDRLWVKETWCCKMDCGEFVYKNGKHECYYRATEKEQIIKDDGDGGTAYRSSGYEASPWVSSLFMPRWASRLTLEIVSVRVETLQQITDEDCKAEGIELLSVRPGSYRYQFRNLWDSINGKTYPWKSNPWVWVIGFRRV